MGAFFMKRIKFVDSLISSLFKKIKKFFINIKFVDILFINKFFNIYKRHQAINKHPQDWDKQLVYSLSRSRIPNWRQIKYIKKFLSSRELLIIRISLVIIFFNVVFLGYNFYESHLQLAPAFGGEYAEALVGYPQYINPIYSSLNDVDQDISSLIFSSLFKRDENGKLIPDLVESYEIKDNGRIYDFTLKDNVRWHNTDETLTTDDVIFTVEAIKNPSYKSPLFSSFSDIKIEKIDKRRFRFVLGSPYAAFLELLTFGILPEKIWSEVPAESANLVKYNFKPIGSGPYKFEKLIKDENTGRITSYVLTVNKDYYFRKPFIEKIIFNFYPNFEEAISALNQNLVDGINYLPVELENNLASPGTLNFYKLYSPQLTAIFLNVKNKFLSDKKVRQALAYSINRQAIINDVFAGEASSVDSPIFNGSFAYNQDVIKYDFQPQKASQLLDESGWKLINITENDLKEANENKNSDDKSTKEQAEKKILIGEGTWRKKDGQYLKIKLTTVDRGKNAQVAEEIKKFWKKIGIKTEVEVVPASQISEIIKPRNFDALFYGQIVGIDPDSYVFWHSSQAVEGGLNITGYSNKEVDKLLEEGRTILSQDVRSEKYKEFQKIITEDEPAIFMYSPYYIYIQDKKIKNFHTQIILSPSGRFTTIADWYIKTGKKIVW